MTCVRVPVQLPHGAAWMVRPRLSVSAAQRSDADGRVQDQEQLERRALLAHATATGRTVDSQCECDAWKWLIH